MKLSKNQIPLISDLETFANNSMMLNATLRPLEIIGEASNRLSEDIIE